jgi:hypothetical protein
MKLPDSYLELIAPFIAQARGFLESGEKLSSIAFVGNFATREMTPILIDSGNDAAKDGSSLAIQLNAETINADFVLIVMEAWGLMKKHAPRHQEIVEEFGSIGKSPYREDVVSFSLETNHGVWFGMTPIRPKPPSKKRRTFGVVNFIYADGVEGRFVGLLPKKAGDGILH